jgi:hypothetical protein
MLFPGETWLRDTCYNAVMRIVLAFVMLMPLVTRAATLDKPLYAEVFLKSNNQKLAGNVTQWDSEGIVIHVGDQDRKTGWPEITPASAFTLRQRLIDKKSASDWLALGTMAWHTGLKDQAKMALNSAVKLDPKLKPQVDDLLSKPATRPMVVHASIRPGAAPVKYIKSTPQEDADAIATAQKVAGSVGEAMKIKFTEIQTAHFIVFTDWAPAEFDFLKTNLEAAYGAVSRQFEIPVKDNVFVGKLPVFMFKDQRSFLSYAHNFDDLPANPNLLGYYAAHGDGTGHMAMWKPNERISGSTGRTPEEQWAYTLTHEFTHAFVDRYRTSRRIPRWLNEGIAEVIAQGQFPQTSTHIEAREMAIGGMPLGQLFDDEVMPGGEYYPVMQTMVEMLIQQDRRAFLKWFDAMKEGDKPEASLKKYFGIDYAGLENAWREHMSRGEIP